MFNEFRNSSFVRNDRARDAKLLSNLRVPKPPVAAINKSNVGENAFTASRPVAQASAQIPIPERVTITTSTTVEYSGADGHYSHTTSVVSSYEATPQGSLPNVSAVLEPSPNTQGRFTKYAAAHPDYGDNFNVFTTGGTSVLSFQGWRQLRYEQIATNEAGVVRKDFNGAPAPKEFIYNQWTGEVTLMSKSSSQEI